MQVSYSQDEQKFRDEVRTWLKENTPDEIIAQTLGGSTLDPVLQKKYHKILAEKEWIGPAFPKELGGAGFGEMEQFIFNYEYSVLGAPRLKTQLMSVGMIGPLLLQFGTKEQKERFIPDMLSGETIWCQGFSEPNAGSDLASLKTKAELDGDELVLYGQKTWISIADYADWVFTLVRTDSSGRKQQGITFLLVDLKSPGVTVRPIEALTDHSPFCEIFFDNVRVPVTNIVGEIHDGWNIAKALMQHERLNAFPIGELVYAVETVRKNAEKTKFRGKPLIEDPVFRRKYALLEIDCQSLLYTFFMLISQLKTGSAPGPQTSFLKVYGGELYQRAMDLDHEAIGSYGMSWYNEDFGNDVHQATMGMINSRSLTIWGGSSEIQRTIIATQVLNLPRK